MTMFSQLYGWAAKLASPSTSTKGGAAGAQQQQQQVPVVPELEQPEHHQLCPNCSRPQHGLQALPPPFAPSALRRASPLHSRATPPPSPTEPSSHKHRFNVPFAVGVSKLGFSLSGTDNSRAMDARTFLSQAQKAESGAGGGWFNFNKQDKLEDAAELYVKAGNAFNTSGQPVDAGNAYEKAAYVYEQLNEPDSAARHRLDAFTALRKTAQWQQGVQNLEKAIQHNSSSNINRAADNQKKLGEFWEEKGGKGTENQNPEFLRLAVEAFAKAGGWYLQTGMDANGNKCLIKDAEISAYLGDFFRAFNTYEGVTRETGQNEILSWSKREWLMMAGLCRLADGDIISAKREIPNYWRLEKSFVPPNCGELNFLMDLLEAIEGQDEEKYEQAKFKHQMYFQSNQLRAWLVNVAKEKNITEAGDDLT